MKELANYYESERYKELLDSLSGSNDVIIEPEDDKTDRVEEKINEIVRWINKHEKGETRPQSES